jgi:ATP-binding cassette subfamily F protein 3
LDEPTNHLDFKTISWLEDYLKTYSGALLIVSHDRFFLDRLCTSVCEIDDGKLTRYKGNYTAFVKLREEAIARKVKEYEAQQEEIAKMEDYVVRNITRASTSKSAKSRVKALERMEVIEKPKTYKKSPKMSFEYDITPPTEILKIKNIDIAISSENSHTHEPKILVSDISFDLKRGEKLAIIGENGTGKSTLLKILCRKIPLTNGRIRWAENVKISYFEQENTSLNPKHSVFEEIHSRFPRMSDFDIRSVLGKVRLVGENVFKPVGAISGGERAKIRFAVMMLERGNVLIFDEPTNHLDLSAKEVLETALAEFGGTVIFVSHDRYLLSKVAMRIIEIGENVAEYRNFADYQDGKPYIGLDCVKSGGNSVQNPAETLQEKSNNPENLQVQPDNSSKNINKKAQRAENANKRAKIRELENRIAELEELIKATQEEITKPEIYENYTLMHEKCENIDSYKIELDEKLEELVELDG